VFLLNAYEGLPVADQVMHGVHFLLCGFAVAIACVPLFTEKGSLEHKFGGRLYVPVSAAAFLLACVMAWVEQSLLLMCFNAFCAYLLLSGWRAMHEKERPALIDWMIPGGLFILSTLVTLHALVYDEGIKNLYLLFFALNGYCLVWRDWTHLKNRAYWARHKKFFPDVYFTAMPENDWLNRHIAGMVGSAVANLSVVVLTVLPLQLHWLWPATLMLASAIVALRRLSRKQKVAKSISPVLRPKFALGKLRPVADDEDLRRAA